MINVCTIIHNKVEEDNEYNNKILISRNGTTI